MNNFEKIKAMDIDEMAELLKQIAYKLLKQTADIVNNSLGEKTPDVPIEMFESIKTDFKQWLESEVRE